MLNLLDRIACKWLDWRQSQNIAQWKRDNPEMSQDMGIHKVEVGSHEMEMVLMHPGIYVMADEAAAFLNANNAKNIAQKALAPYQPDDQPT